MIRARAIIYLAMVFAVFGGCTPRARENGRASITERIGTADDRGARAPAANSAAAQTERATAAEEYFRKNTGGDEDEFDGMKRGLPMLLFIALIAAAIGAL